MAQKGELPTLDLYDRLHAAVRAGNMSEIKTLMQHSQATSVLSKPPRVRRLATGPHSFLTVPAAAGGQAEVLSYLITQLRDVEDTSRTPQYRQAVDLALVTAAAASLDLPTLRVVVEDYRVPLAPSRKYASRNRFRLTPLAAAVGAAVARQPAQRNDSVLEVLRYLLSKGAEKNVAQDAVGETALCCAARAGWAEGVEALLEGGVSPHPLRPKHRHPLHVACKGQGERIAVIHMLLRAGADPNWTDSKGRSALFAVPSNRGDARDVLLTLLQGGADARLKVRGGNTVVQTWWGEGRALLQEWHDNGRWLLYRGAAVLWRTKVRAEARAAREIGQAGEAAK